MDNQRRRAGQANTDLWRLPDVVSIEMELARYPEPRIFFVGTERRTTQRAVEFVVRTSSELPERALSPALFVGDIPVLDYETVGRNTYRFFGYDFERFRADAPLALGWPQFPDRRVNTRFRYRLRGEAIA